MGETGTMSKKELIISIKSRYLIQNGLQEHPQLIVIHIGTNTCNLTPTTPIDAFISDTSVLLSVLRLSYFQPDTCSTSPSKCN